MDLNYFKKGNESWTSNQCIYIFEIQRLIELELELD